MSDLSVRVIEALDANDRTLLASIRQLMAEAWEEGFDYARNESWTEESNPYTAPETGVPVSCPTRLMDGRNEIRCWLTAGHEGECK